MDAGTHEIKLPIPNAITPQHYKVGDPMEVINIIEHYELDFCIGNTLKYILRAGKKNEDTLVEDYRKAIWYLERKIKNIESKKT